MTTTATPNAHGLALIGAGGQGDNHLKALALLAENPPRGTQPIRLEALIDPRRDHAEPIARALSVPWYPNLAALVADREVRARVQGVISCVPNHLHATLGKEIAAAGFHGLSEKPISPSDEDSQELIRAFRDAGLVLKIGYHWPDRLEWARQNLWRIGPVTGAELEFTLWDSVPANPDYWDTPEGGALTDLAGHPFTGFRSVVPDADPICVEIESWSNRRGRQLYGEKFRAEDSARGVIVCSDDLTVGLHVSWATGRAPKKRLNSRYYGLLGEMNVPFYDEGATLGFEPDVRRYGVGTIVGAAGPTYIETLAFQILRWVGAWEDERKLTLLPHHAREAELVVGALRRAARSGNREYL